MTMLMLSSVIVSPQVEPNSRSHACARWEDDPGRARFAGCG